MVDSVYELLSLRARVFVVRKGTQAIAGGFTLGYRGSIEVPWASSLREFRSICPNYLLYWAMIEFAIAHGFDQFDFGRLQAWRQR